MDKEEQQWLQSQKEITKQKLSEKQAKAYQSNQRAVVLLEKCKFHSGPLASVEESESTLKTMKDDKKRKHMLCNELLFCKLICKHDFQENPSVTSSVSVTLKIWALLHSIYRNN